MKQLFVILISMLVSTACSPSGKQPEIQAIDIISLLEKGEHVFLDSCIIWGDLDFTVLLNRNKIAANLIRVFVEQSVTFNGCLFTGKVKAFDAQSGVSVAFAHNVSFIGCDFREEVDFTESTVGGNVFFTGSTFRAQASWQGACFHHKKVYFSEAHFEDAALFQGAVFAGEVYFLHTVFGSTAMFQKMRVGGLLFLGNTRFEGYTDFTYARALESIFSYTQFKGRSDFGYSQLNAGKLPETIRPDM